MPHCHRYEVRRWLRDRDREGKGHVDWEDFLSSYGYDPAPRSPARGGQQRVQWMNTSHTNLETDMDVLRRTEPPPPLQPNGPVGAQDNPFLYADDTYGLEEKSPYRSNRYGDGVQGGGRYQSQRTSSSSGLLDPQREWAIRRAFDVYDINGDGTISYLELRTVLGRQGREVTEHQLREWIRARDRSGSGVVSFADFRAAFIRQQQDRL